MGEREREEQHAEIEFESGEGEGLAPRMRITGIAEELLRSPERIRQLMELLELPKGTKARVTIASSTVIIR